MKYVILIHSNPQPWTHPTSDNVPEHQALPEAERKRLGADFDALLADLSERGELIGGEALDDPANARLYRWRNGKPVATDGPYAEAKEHFAGFFLVDMARRERAEEIATRMSGPGETVELRPTWTGPE